MELQSERTPIERRMDLVLSWLLRGGVIASAAIVLGGWSVLLVRLESRPALLPILQEGRLIDEHTVAHSVANVAEGLAHGSARAWIAIGLMLLISLPVLRVAMTSVLFGLERDWLYVALTVLVFGLLLSGLLLGRAL